MTNDNVLAAVARGFASAFPDRCADADQKWRAAVLRLAEQLLKAEQLLNQRELGITELQRLIDDQVETETLLGCGDLVGGERPAEIPSPLRRYCKHWRAQSSQIRRGLADDLSQACAAARGVVEACHGQRTP